MRHQVEDSGASVIQDEEIQTSLGNISPQALARMKVSGGFMLHSFKQG